MDEQHGRSTATGSHNRPDPELVLTHLDGLPTLSAVALKVLEVTADSDSSAADVIELVRGDQSLTAKILSVTASAWAGQHGSVTTLEKAVPLLGFRSVRSIVLAVNVFDNFASDKARADKQAFERTEFWKHALAVACISRKLAAARKELQIEPEAAFVAGLLHDLGKVALSAVFPKAYDRIAGQANQSGGDIADFERSILGADHTVAGRRLAERWRLPRELQEVIWLHHLVAETLPESVLNPNMITIVHLADTLAREQHIGYSGNYLFFENSPGLAARMGITETQIDTIMQTLVCEVVELAELLGLGHEAPDTMYMRAMTRANVELGRLNTELSISSRKLSTGTRYFRAISQFDQRLSAWWDPPAVAHAATFAAVVALQREKLAVFGLRHNQAALDLCWTQPESGGGGSLSQSVPAELAEWAAEPGGALDVVLMHAPPPIRDILHPAINDLGRGTAWLVPVTHDRKVIGGIVYCSDNDERALLSEEAEDLRSFTTSLGLALGRANAQAAARRLSDDLAETNRRLQQMQVELLRSRTLSMIAEMASGAGHELNGPLTVISGRAQMLMKAYDDPDTQRSLELIRGKAHECSQIVSELMDFARPRAPQREPVVLGELLDQARTEWLERTRWPAARLQLDLQGSETGQRLEIPGDYNQLKIVFNELIANAVDAVADNEDVIHICCRPAVNAGFLEVTVRDGGCGMSPAVLQRAFDPFFSHRHAGRSRGLGLPKAYRIVEGHGGRIWLNSTPDEGTTAHVLLPISTALDDNHPVSPEQ